ncbi:MAG: hypothetical protein M3209_16110 [Acidobacteriota bacterium]|nr:hypothetical protein [Acidobacteriota bacterium]
MKRILFNLSIASLAFLFGVFVQNLTKSELKPAAPITIVDRNIKTEIPRTEIKETSLSGVNQSNGEFLDEDSGGWYMVDDFKGMREVWTILLTRDDEKEKNGKPA